MKYFRSVLVFCFVLLSCLELMASEPSNNDRIMKSSVQVMTALVIKSEIDDDKNCTTAKYSDFNLKEWTDSFPKDKETEAEKANIIKLLKEAVEKQRNTRAPNSSKVLSRVVYENMRDAFVKQNEQLGVSGNYCDQMYRAASNIFQKSKDNLRLLK